MRTNVFSVIESIERACDEIGSLSLSGIKLENPDPKLLDVMDGDFDLHVAMQPAAIAYYGMLLKYSKRELVSNQRAYEHWKKKTFQEAKKILSQSVDGKPAPKSTIADIESYIIMNYEKEIEEWENKVEELQSSYDIIESWYDAWRQKSFSLKEISISENEEKYLKDHMNSNENKNSFNNNVKNVNSNDFNNENESSFDRIRRIQNGIKNRKEV